jgi:hypothetical protein
MVCPGFFLKKLLDFTYVRSKDDEKVISIRNVNDEYDLLRSTLKIFNYYVDSMV